MNRNVVVLASLLLAGCATTPGDHAVRSTHQEAPEQAHDQLLTIAECADAFSTIGRMVLPGQPFDNPGSTELWSDGHARTVAVSVDVFPTVPSGELLVRLENATSVPIWEFAYPSDGTSANFSIRFPDDGPYVLAWQASGTFRWIASTYTFGCDLAEREPDVFRIRTAVSVAGDETFVDCESEPVHHEVLDWKFSGIEASLQRETFTVPPEAFRMVSVPYVADFVGGSWHGLVLDPQGQTAMEWTSSTASGNGNQGIWVLGAMPSGNYTYEWQVSGIALNLGLPVQVLTCRGA